MAPTREVMEIALGGLLHDLGKFRQRTGLKITNERNFEYCPSKDGHSTHVHAAHTAQALEDLFEPKGLTSGAVFRYACEHHRQGLREPGERIVQMADWLASGHDRHAHSEYSDAMAADEVAQQADYIKSRQIPAICRVAIRGRPPAPENMVYPVRKLGPDVLPLPLEAVSRKDAREEYLALWEAFAEDVRGKLPDFRPDDNWLGALTSLLELYTWAIPASSYKNLPETSLFDHCRLVAAFGCALYRYCEEKGLEALVSAHDGDEPILRLIQGDFAGIQKFIFDFRGESQKYAAKMLRARSFHVSLMTEAVAGMVCERFGLPRVAVVMNAGGKFTILAPNLPGANEWVEQIRSDLDRETFADSFGQTRFALASVEARPSDFALPNGKAAPSGGQSESPFGRLLEAVTMRLEAVKTRPEIPEPVFGDYLRDLGEYEVCATCGTRPAREGDLCASCSTFRKVGEALVRRERRFLAITEGGRGFSLIGGLRYTFHEPGELPGEGVHFDLGDAERPGRFRGVAIRHLAAHVPVFEPGDGANPLYEDLGKEGDQTSAIEGAHKTFQHIGRDACDLRERPNGKLERVGRDHIAILKADIDSLGEVFLKGFEDQTISRIVGLSRMLDYFFTGWLPSRLAEEYRSTYTIFAGGDDLLLVGPWKQSVTLAGEIRSHLAEYAGGNPSISISAGLTLSKPGSPLRQAIGRAESDLEAAKASSWEGMTKNAITAFGESVPWTRFEQLLEISGNLQNLLAAGVSVAFVYRLFEFVRMKEAAEKDVMNTRWRALFRYLTYRNYGDKEKAKALLPRLLEIPEWIEEYGSGLKIALSNALYQRRR